MSGDLFSAVRVLKAGGVIAYPTETSYGLGCDPRNAKAVRRIFQIKGRGQSRAVLLVASSIDQVKRVAVLKGPALKLARKHWPGALTLVLPFKRGARLSRSVVKGREVAIRVSSSPLVKKLTRQFGFPIVSTSANRSGSKPAFSGIGVCRAFHYSKYKPDFVLNAGKLPKRKPSTVARVKKDGTVEILREGAIAANSLQPPS